ncbi:MAG TPA: hypothetical protein VG713_11810 [Pirellulales bacterium]|nr:hypothetical protein [Pirellulales bacterium]
MASVRMAIAIAGVSLLLGRDAAAQGASPFVGQFSGTYTFSSTDPRFGNQAGYIAMTITAEGRVSANVQNTTINLPSTVRGTVSDDGDFDCVAEASNQVYTLKGTMVKSKAGNLKATLTQYFGANQAIGSVQFDIPPYREKQ